MARHVCILMELNQLHDIYYVELYMYSSKLLSVARKFNISAVSCKIIIMIILKLLP